MRDKSVEYSCAAELAVSPFMESGGYRFCVSYGWSDTLWSAGTPYPFSLKKRIGRKPQKASVRGLIVRNDPSNHILYVEYDLAEPVKAATYELLDQLAKWGTRMKAMIRTILNRSKR
ncbi:hypothetical protein HNQ77_004786 [Silvibacterium bohemicum]|uniref:Uncharacterized protein n=1 Tax=Silvibacterium bohemicum TaxID=1577686 RepID=A0A841K1D9_9BACT|nr:hypothetical protein [Silvibacterium bohemicum]